MVKLNEKSDIYFELYEAVAHYMSRQQLVVRAVVDLGVVPEDLVKGVGGWFDKTEQIGTWREWKFFFHGGGCMLKHPETGEPIDWNGPDTHSFDPYFFLRHLLWRLENGAQLQHLKEHIEHNGDQSVVELILDLIADGIISEDYHLEPSARVEMAVVQPRSFSNQ